METRRRRLLATGATLLGGAAIATLGLATWRVLHVLDRGLRIVSNGDGDTGNGPATAVILLAAAGVALLAGALALALAARRAALTIERASLVELSLVEND